MFWMWVPRKHPRQQKIASQKPHDILRSIFFISLCICYPHIVNTRDNMDVVATSHGPSLCQTRMKRRASITRTKTSASRYIASNYSWPGSIAWKRIQRVVICSAPRWGSINTIQQDDTESQSTGLIINHGQSATLDANNIFQHLLDSKDRLQEVRFALVIVTR
jgi:hypothetical protein